MAGFAPVAAVLAVRVLTSLRLTVAIPTSFVPVTPEGMTSSLEPHAVVKAPNTTKVAIPYNHVFFMSVYTLFPKFGHPMFLIYVCQAISIPQSEKKWDTIEATKGTP